MWYLVEIPTNRSETFGALFKIWMNLRCTYLSPTLYMLVGPANLRMPTEAILSPLQPSLLNFK